MKSIRTYTFVFFGLLMAGLGQAQEIRLQGNLMVLGYIENPFMGFGVAYENGLGQHFAVGLDVNAGWQEEATAIDFRPAVRYYFGQEHFGFFGGVAFKYISLNEKAEDADQWADNLFAPGFELGVKARMSQSGVFGLTVNPHLTVGGGDPESNVAGMSAQVFFGYRF